MTQASDMVMGTFSKTFQKKVKSEKKGAQKDSPSPSRRP